MHVLVGSFPGMMITYRLIERLEEIAEKSDVVQIVNKARASRLITAPDGSTVGVEYEVEGANHIAYGPVRRSHRPLVWGSGGVCDGPWDFS